MEFLLFKTRLVVAWFFKNIDNFNFHFFSSIVHLLVFIYLLSLRFENVIENFCAIVSLIEEMFKRRKSYFINLSSRI